MGALSFPAPMPAMESASPHPNPVKEDPV